jgi:hypothetical protein
MRCTDHRAARLSDLLTTRREPLEARAGGLEGSDGGWGSGAFYGQENRGREAQFTEPNP